MVDLEIEQNKIGLLAFCERSSMVIDNLSQLVSRRICALKNCAAESHTVCCTY